MNAASVTSTTGAQDARANDELVIEHVDLVQHVVHQVALRYPRHVDRDELWNAGALGLVEAARRYKPETGVPFARYAKTRIRGAIIDSTRTRDWAARGVRRKARELTSAQEQFEASNGRSPEDFELAKRLGVGESELLAIRTAAVSSSLLHLDQHHPEQQSPAYAIRELSISSLPEEALEQREMLGTLRSAVQFLAPAHRDIIDRYYLRGEKLLDIATSMGVSEARISQIAAEAINALRAYMGQLYEGVPEVADDAPGKRNRAAYLASAGSRSTWSDWMQAADESLLERLAVGL